MEPPWRPSWRIGPVSARVHRLPFGVRMRVSVAILAVLMGSSAALAQSDGRANPAPAAEAAPTAKAKASPKAKSAHKKDAAKPKADAENKADDETGTTKPKSKT